MTASFISTVQRKQDRCRKTIQPQSASSGFQGLGGGALNKLFAILQEWHCLLFFLAGQLQDSHVKAFQFLRSLVVVNQIFLKVFLEDRLAEAQSFQPSQMCPRPMTLFRVLFAMAMANSDDLIIYRDTYYRPHTNIG